MITQEMSRKLDDLWRMAICKGCPHLVKDKDGYWACDDCKPRGHGISDKECSDLADNEKEAKR